MTTFVLIPGACHGGWWYDPLVAELEERGHRAIAVTLAGLEDEPNSSAAAATLDTHIGDVAAVVDRATHDNTDAGGFTGAVAGAVADGNVVLVGHSYAGSVLSGVADAVPDRIRALVYLDAFVPEDGDSCWAMTDDEQRRWYIEGAGRTGIGVDPLPFFDARARPHPLASLVQRSRLTGAWRSVPVKHYVAATGWAGPSPFAATTERVRRDPTWTVHEWATRHNVLHDGPERVLELLAPL